MAQSFDLEQWPSTRIALETRTPVMIESLDDPRLGDEQRTSMRERGEVSLMAVPLVARGEAFGTVELVDRRSRTCTKDEMRTLEAVCNAAALAIRNADMFGREHENATRLASVLDASRAITEELGEKSRLSAPLVFDGEPIGMLVLIETERVRHFKPEELELVQALAEQAAVAIQNARQYEDVRRMHANNLRTLCTALNAKDYYTLGHTARVAAYMKLLGKELGWSSEAVHRIGEAAYLHDIGKIGIPDRILTKAGKLNQREWELMRQHPALSADIIRPLYGDDVVLGVRHHHERYDGRGYPDGLAGEDIPLIARAMCTVDSYDAMSFDRPYHRGLSFTDCLAELERCKGSQFDPVMVDAFAQVLADITSVRQRGLAIGAQAAALIDVDAHVALVESGSEDDSAYSETVRILCAVRDANPGVRYMTTVARRAK